MINDSAGIEVPLIDKSERTSTAVGFRSAAVIEAERGLCETPTLIASEADYVKVFGTPTVDKTGMASIEAYSLSQRQVPQVIVRAKRPNLPISAKQFAAFRFGLSEGSKKLDVVNTQPASAVAIPPEDSKAVLYFKGEGAYPCKKQGNIVLRFSKPTEESAYAKDSQVLRLQVYDFAGESHIDSDQVGRLVFNPTLNDIVDAEGSFASKLDELFGTSGSTQVAECAVTAYVNGVAGSASYDGASSSEGSSFDFWSLVKDAIGNAKTRNWNDELSDYDPVLPAGSWNLAGPSKTVTGNDSDKYVETVVDAGTGKSVLNAFELSISLAVKVKLLYRAPEEELTEGYYELNAGTLSVSVVGSGEALVEATLSSAVVLHASDKYMYTGDYNEYWAAFYETYRKETWDLSFSYDDFDASYVSLQADAVLAASNYLICKTGSSFGEYEVEWGKKEGDVWIDKPDALVSELQYFDCDSAITPNEIEAASKSFAYSQALSLLLLDNLTRWRCVCTPNLGDVMIRGDFVAAIESAQECSLGLSNIGRAASVDALHNLSGCHGNRFIADFSVYGYRSLNGRRTPFTMACLVAELLNRNYKNGNEARPPFGYTYGQVICNEISQVMTGPERLMLARQCKVNPVIEDGGYYLWDERTSQLKETSLSDVHSILSFIWMKFQIYDTMKSFIAEYNDVETVNRGLSQLNDLCQLWIAKKYVEEALADANKNVIGDETLRFTVRVRFKGVARYVVVEVVAYPQTQSLAISLAQEAA